MKKKFLLLLAGLAAVFMLSACGEKSQEEVVKELTEKMEEMKGYKVNATMTLEMGKEPQTYEVEVWHKNPGYYRVNLKNANKEQSQMILRNDEGVFVLTPALNKSFRFQSDWPENSSQAYLFESLVQDIIDDKEAKFKATDKHYVFETKTRYQNSKMLPIQEIILKKKDLTPVSVKVMDTDRNPMVTVEFSDMEINAKLEEKDFDMAKNMTGAQLEIPVMADLDKREFTVKYPSAEIPGASLIDERTVETENSKRVILTYDGEEKSFTLIQEQAKVEPAAVTATPVHGEPVDLGFTIGILTDNSLSWTHEGVDYMIASKNLTAKEMIMLAQSMEEEEDMMK